MWFVLLILGPLDRFTGAASFTRGILTPESCIQALTASFTVFSVGMVILLLVRIIAVNGDERFECADTVREGSWLRSHWGTPDLPLYLFILAHLPGAILILGFVGPNMLRESALPLGQTIGFLILGVMAAFVFWLFVGLLYYWTFDATVHTPVPRELILPRVLIPLSDRAIRSIHQQSPPPLSRWLKPIFKLIARLGKGYANPLYPEYLYEGHRLTFLAMTGLIVLYVFFFSFTAPVPIAPLAATFSNTVAILAVAVALAGCGLGAWPKAGAPRIVKGLAVLLLTVILIALPLMWRNDVHAARGFSVLGSVLILVTGIFWILATIAFACDSTRLPVLSVSIVSIVLLKGCAPYPSEHYFTVHTQTAQFSPALQPAQILEDRIADAATNSVPNGDLNAPALIVITAQGGGIHSAAWTANVLTQLENTFRNTPGAPAFHSRILLASGVSGGSVGLLPFLREYTASEPFPLPRPSGKGSSAITPIDSVRARVTLAANCSSLQAIAWGLSYYDILNFLSPIPFFRPASGVAATGTGSSGYDRSWALERSLDRNLTDHGCLDDGLTAPGMKDGYQLTLHGTAELLAAHSMPAFTFNTTAAETGGRFLLANYELPEQPILASPMLSTDILPAESFLHAFSHENAAALYSGTMHRQYADMPLVTAARLSATFPFVSSASRIPVEASPSGFHFIDGGYYDNDGTASAMEFLFWSLQGSGQTKAAEDPVVHKRKIPILLIEIRNDPDIPTTANSEGFPAQNQLVPSGRPATPTTFVKESTKKPIEPWGPDEQLLAPIQGFYQAGHGSDTRRNRRELCVFETAFRDRFAIHHMVFDYRNPVDKNQPLSWDLTPNQQKNISCALDPYVKTCQRYESEQKEQSENRSINTLAQDAANWVANDSKGSLPNEACTIFGLGPAIVSAQ